MNLVRSLRAARDERRYSLEQYASDVNNWLYYGPGLGITQTYDQKPQGQSTERSESPFEAWVQAAYKRNGVIFACQVARLKLFTEARFQWQQMRRGRPADLFGTPDLILEKPWPNGTTGDLLAKMLQDVDLAGNAYIRRTGPLTIPRLERLRPDWVDIVLAEDPDLLTLDVIGYLYHPGGPGRRTPIPLARGEVAHWSPIPDPIASYRGMSWLTPVIREVQADASATHHKQQFFDHAATPNMVIKFEKGVDQKVVDRFAEKMDAEHSGAMNAGKNLYLGGGADVTVVGQSFKDMDYKQVMAAGETRIAAAAGVPPVIVGLSEGLESATYSNYSQARRRFADMTTRPDWRSCCGALETVASPPTGARLWYDDRDIPALKDDEKDAAATQQVQASTITALVREGFTPESSVQAVMTEDMHVLVHTGRVSVQLFDPAGSPDTKSDRQLSLVEMIQKIYLGVGSVVTKEEAREILNQAGANLTGPGPTDEPTTTEGVSA